MEGVHHLGVILGVQMAREEIRPVVPPTILSLVQEALEPLKKMLVETLLQEEEAQVVQVVLEESLCHLWVAGVSQKTDLEASMPSTLKVKEVLAAILEDREQLQEGQEVACN